MAALKDPALVDAVMRDYRTAPIGDALKATLAFVEKLTMTPGAIGVDDIAALRAAGVTDEAIRSAIYVCFGFNLITRLADSFDFPREDARGLKWVGRILTSVGYSAGSLPG